MKLDSVYEVRERVRARASSFGFSFLGRYLDVSLGVGMTGRPNDYRLAVRLRGFGPLHWRFAVAAAGLAKGEVDTQSTGPVRVISGKPAGSPPNNAPLGIGASIGHAQARGGTVGFFARRRSDGRLGVVSNNHVIAVEDQAADGAPIVHPAFGDGDSRTIARLDGGYPRLQGGGLKEVDCAFAPLEPGVTPNLSSLGSDGPLRQQIAVARNSMNVFKRGRTTRRTAGRITAFDFDTLVVRDYHFGDVSFKNQIEIESADGRAFSDDGDSGSLIYDPAGHPVGLLFAETSRGGNNNAGLHYANPIGLVLDALRVDLAV